MEPGMNKQLALRGTLLAAVAKYCERGWLVLPCKPDKSPWTKNGVKNATLDAVQLEGSWKKHPDALIGLAMGPRSGVFAVDIDVDETKQVNGLIWLKSQCETHGALPLGPVAITPRGGRHYYFKYPENRKIGNSVGKLHKGVDVRGVGGYVIAPPSVGEKGEYCWEIAPEEQTVPDAPDWLLELTCEPPDGDPPLTDPMAPPSAQDMSFIEQAIERQLDAVRKAEKGTRNSALNSAAFVLGKIVGSGAVEESAVVERLTEAARSVGLEPDEIRRTIASGLRAGKRKPWRPFARDEKLNEINRDHFFAIEGKAAFVYREEIDPVTERRALRRTYTGAFELEMRNKFIAVGTNAMGEVRHEKLGKRWLEWPGRRQFKGVVFDPRGTTPDEYYNQWHGLAAEPLDGDCSKFLNFIRDVLCSGDQKAFDYLIRWCARAVQEPATPGEVAIVLKGAKGIGKTFFASHLGELFGDHYVEMSHSRHLVGNFNAHLETAIMAFADEAFWAGDKPGEGTLKALVTSRTLLFERKGIDAHAGPNYVHLIIASNSDWVVPASPDERRFFVLDVPETRRGDHKYFAEIDAEWRQGGREAFLYHLANLDLAEFNVRNVPQTEALFEQKLLSFNSVDRWYFHLLQKGANCGPGSPIGRTINDSDWVGWIETQSLYTDYQTFCEILVVRHVPPEAFGTRLNYLLPPAGDGRKRRCQRGSADKRSWGYEFPTLNQCRAHFEKKIGFTIVWESEGEVSPAPKDRY
jgi:hypothetical protein